jgi:hypothetical protein
VIATTDPATLPDATTWYLVTKLPAPGAAAQSPHAPATVADVVQLYGLRVWVEQSYKQIKQTLGWAEYQVRADVAIRRHWHLVYCAFSFCWWASAHDAPTTWELPGAVRNRRLRSAGRRTKWCHPSRRRGEKSRAAITPAVGLGSWPMALRQIRAWLEPGILRWRYWRAWSAKPPPPARHRLLDWLWEGRGIALYVR